jgi:hypothetical protein
MLSQQPMANYRVSMNKNSSNKTTQDKTNKKNNKRNSKKQGKMDWLRLFVNIRELLKISVHLQTAFAVKTHITED